MADNSVAGLQQRYGEHWRWLAVATVMAGVATARRRQWFIAQAALGSSATEAGLLMLPALSMGALNPLAPEELGAGSSTISFTRQLGGAFGVNMVALAIEHSDHQNGMPTVEAFQFA